MPKITPWKLLRERGRVGTGPTRPHQVDFCILAPSLMTQKYSQANKKDAWTENLATKINVAWNRKFLVLGQLFPPQTFENSLFPNPHTDVSDPNPRETLERQNPSGCNSSSTPLPISSIYLPVSLANFTCSPVLAIKQTFILPILTFKSSHSCSQPDFFESQLSLFGARFWSNIWLPGIFLVLKTGGFRLFKASLLYSWLTPWFAST